MMTKLIGVLVLITGFSSLAGTHSSGLNIRQSSSDLPLDRSDCLYCGACENESMHDVLGDVETGNSTGSGHAHCSAIGSCQSGHANHSWIGPGGCSGGLAHSEDMNTLRLAATAGNTDSIRAIRDRYPDSVFLNTNRRAIQVIGCDGGVVAQLVLERDVFEAVSAQ